MGWRERGGGRSSAPEFLYFGYLSTREEGRSLLGLLDDAAGKEYCTEGP